MESSLDDGIEKRGQVPPKSPPPEPVKKEQKNE